MSKCYRNYSNEAAADWYAHDQGVEADREMYYEKLVEETTERNKKELLESSDTTLIDDTVITLEDLIEKVNHEMFEEFIVRSLYYYYEEGRILTTVDFIKYAIDECEEWLYNYNKEHVGEV